jgi:two-component system cell cycle sensor histidine kinase/response regulator CckA
VANGIRGFTQTEDGSIWAATDHDISRFDGQAWTSGLLPAKLVLPHDGGSLRSGRSGRIWVNHFPAEWMWRAWARAPAVSRRPAGEEFWTVGHTYVGPPPDTMLTLAPVQIDPPGNLSVAWRGVVPWRSPEEARLQFSHRLNDEPWSDYSAQMGQAFFSLVPGRHRLEVRARDRDFNVDPTPAVLEFTVLPPVWRQGWFVGLMGLGAGLLAMQAVRLVQQQVRLRRANRELAAESIQHKHAEQARAASEERFRELAETIDEVFWMTDVEKRRMLYISPAYERIWGRSGEALYANPQAWVEAILPEDRDRVMAAAMQKQTTGDYQEEYRIRRPDGTVRWIYDRAFPVYNARGEVERVVGVARDITERKQAQDELRTKEEYFQSLIEHSSDLISVLTVDGLVRYQSPAAGRMLSRPAVMPDSPSIYDLIHPDDQAAVRTAIRQAAASVEEPVSVEFRVKTFDGRMRVLQSLGRWLSGTGADTLVVVNSRDVTEMQELEKQFRQAQKMDALGQLAGGVAHDFNNLLTVITGNACLLKMQGAGTGENAELLHDIQTSADRAASLTRQLLVFSRQEKAQKKEVDLTGLVSNLGKLLRRLISEEVAIEMAVASEPLWLWADAGMIEQVVMNLAINARDAMPQGGRLFIKTGAALPAEVPAELASPCALLEVTDSGTGIPANILPKIFDPFFTTKEVGKGTGLGLATVFGIVQQHKGRIVVDSVEGRGTTFRIYLPRLETPEATEQSSPKEAVAHGRGECILLVEDEKNVRDFGIRALTGKGYRVLAAANGQAALALWAAHQREIQLLLTDLIMPGGLSGFQLARQMAAEKPDLRVIYSSGYSREIAAQDQPMDPSGYYLPKPYELEDLYRTVRAALDSRSAT